MNIAIRAHGKLLLTAEYAVLEGAEALALPVRYGQTLRAESNAPPSELRWYSVDERQELWFEAVFDLDAFEIRRASEAQVAERLRAVLLACRRQRPSFLQSGSGWTVYIEADYPLEWGLGSSSTLVAALARWAEADPYEVLFETFGGSGYDVACAFAEGPILYRLDKQRRPQVTPVAFHPPFSEQLCFVFWGTKQDSRIEVERFRRHAATAAADWIEAVSQQTRACLSAQTLPEFIGCLRQHERLISSVIGLTPVQEKYFPDFNGAVKSLGAWGGDFVLAASDAPFKETAEYFCQKGFPTCISYDNMVLGASIEKK